MEGCYGRLKEDASRKVVLLRDFNVQVGRSVEVDDVIGKDTCSASDDSSLTKIELVVCVGA